MLTPYIHFILNEKTIITVTIIIFSVIIVCYLYISSLETIDKSKLLDEIPTIINLAQRIEYIQNYIEYTLDDFEHDLPPISEDITLQTGLTGSQLNLLNFIKELKDLHKEWERYKDNNILSNSNIKMPYAIAYHIRELLETPIYKDEDNEDYVWLNKIEMDCIRKYNFKIKEPLPSPNRLNDHITICIKCKEIIRSNEVTDDEDNNNSLATD